MTTCDLGALPQDRATALLLEICPRLGAAADDLARLCGCLPLALRISASVLANDDTLNIARYLERLERERLAALRDPDDSDVDVEASLRLSFDALDGPARGVLCLLGVFAGSFDLVAAAVVGEGSEEAVAEMLGRLRRRNLLEWDAEAERYRLHELVRAFAVGRMEDTEAMWLRHARYYAAVARQVNKLYLQGNDSLLAGLALFDQERANIAAGWSRARERAGNVEADNLQRDYAYLTAYIGSLRYNMRREQIPQLEAAIEAARRIGDRGAEGAWLGNLGLAYSDLGETRRAIEFYEQHLTIAREIGDRRGEGNALFNMSLALDTLGDRTQAIVHAEAALRIYERIEAPAAAKARKKLAEWRDQAAGEQGIPGDGGPAATADGT